MLLRTLLISNIAGVTVSLVLGVAIGELLRPSPIIFYSVVFMSAGVAAAVLAKDRELISVVVLGALFLVLGIIEWFDQNSSDTLSEIVGAGVAKFVFCFLGGVIVKTLSARSKKTSAL